MKKITAPLLVLVYILILNSFSQNSFQDNSIDDDDSVIVPIENDEQCKGWSD